MNLSDYGILANPPPTHGARGPGKTVTSRALVLRQKWEGGAKSLRTIVAYHPAFRWLETLTEARRVGYFRNRGGVYGPEFQGGMDFWRDGFAAGKVGVCS